MHPDQIALRERTRIAYWLLISALMVFLIVVIGGITRLTESGLSITEWKPVSGVIPPLSEAAWENEFAKYRTTPEYQELKRGMSLTEFKNIYFWEYLHRLWGRLVGLVFALPLFFFMARGALSPKLRRVGLIILALIGAQGFLGWYMVQSGLADRTDVSQYRLAAHLSLALVIYVMMLWHGVGALLQNSTVHLSHYTRRITAHAWTAATLAALTIVSGAFVAGTNAGKVHNTFPLMGGRLVPAEYLELTPWFTNLLENPVAIQFNHRVLGILTLLAVTALWIRARNTPLPSFTSTAVHTTLALTVLQAALGITTLLAGTPIHLAALHQGCAVLLLSAITVTLLPVTHSSRESLPHAAP